MSENALEFTYESLGIALIRTPMWPVGTYKACNDKGAQESNDAATRIFQSPAKREALWTASPSLASAVAGYAQGESNPSPKQFRQLHDASLRYLIRMSSRPTPFAALASVGLAHTSRNGEVTMALREAPECHRPTARLDVQYLLNVIHTLEELAEVRHYLQFFTNPVVYESGGRLCIPFTDAYGQGDDRQTASVRYTSALAHTLSQAQHPTPWPGLLKGLQAHAPQASAETLEEFLDTLWRQGILLSTLRPPFTLADPLDWVLERLVETPYRGEVYQKLQTLQEQIKTYNRKLLGSGIDTIKQLYQTTEYQDGASQATIEIDAGLALTRAQISSIVTEELTRAATVLCRTATAPASSQALAEYRGDFIERYGEREIPILELLDEDIGLGPPKGYQNPPPSLPKQASPSPNRPLRDSCLAKLVGEALHNYQREVVLDEAILSQLEVDSEWSKHAPTSLDIFAFIAAQSEQAIDRGDFLAVIGPRVGASPAGRSLGRFCHVLPAELTAWMRTQARTEEEANPDLLIADLVYSHAKGHATNVAIRPALYRYQIAVNTTPSVAWDHVIPLSDIRVGVAGGRFYLKSHVHGKRIVTRSMHLLNFLRAPNVCRFLQEVSEDGQTPLVPFDWGKAAGLPFLPRVRYGKIVLSLAHWQVPRELADLPSDTWVTAWQEWRERWHVPSAVYFSQSDNRLLLDLENPDHLETLQREVRKMARSGPPVTLEEALPGPQDTWVRDGDGNTYISEFIVPLKRPDLGGLAETAQTNEQGVQSITRANAVISHKERVYPPGSEWLYFKLYGGKSRQDDVLLLVSQLATRLANSVNRWFFIRYVDPLPHLRLRFFGESSQLLHEVLPRATDELQQLVQQGLLNKVAIDTYDRELERYGGTEGITISEQLFCFDSEFTCDLTALRLSKKTDLDLHHLGVITVDYLLRGLELGIEERRTLYQDIRQGQQPAFGLNEGQLSKEFRELRPGLCQLFANGDPQLTSLHTSLRERLVPIKKVLVALRQEEKLNKPLEDIWPSYIHMHCNRLGLNRSDEFKVMYDLARLFDGFRHHVPPGISL